MGRGRLCCRRASRVHDDADLGPSTYPALQCVKCDAPYVLGFLLGLTRPYPYGECRLVRECSCEGN